MKKLVLFFIIFFGGLTIINSETIISEFDALKDIESWISQYKKYYNRLPQSMNDLISNYPDNSSFPINNSFKFYTEKLGYIINYNIMNEVKVTLKSGKKIFTYELKNNINYFYIEEYLVIEYSRNENGDIINSKDYFENMLDFLKNQHMWCQ